MVSMLEGECAYTLGGAHKIRGTIYVNGSMIETITRIEDVIFLCVIGTTKVYCIIMYTKHKRQEIIFTPFYIHT